MKSDSCSVARIFNFALLSLLILNCNISSGQEGDGKYEDMSKLINVWLEAQKDYENMPAIMGLVVEDQTILWSGSFGMANVEESTQSDENSITSIGSISKVFTATAIMKLVDEGKISLDDKVKDVLTSFSVHQKFPEGGDITIESLLTHSSGLPRDTHHGYWSGPDFPFPAKEEMLESLATLETTHPVGEDVLYSNIGYSLLGLVIEEASGVAYKKYIESNIFKPLGMSHSFVEMQSSTYGKSHAIGYSASHRNGRREAAGFYQTKAMQPAFGISTTILDLAKFAMWQFRLAEGAESEVLEPSTLGSMYGVHATSADNKVKRGYGYEVYTDKEGADWAMHGGTCPGYVAFLKMDVTNKKAYAILINANRVRAAAYVNGLIRILKNFESIEKEGQPELDLSQYLGFYDPSPWNSEYYVGKWGGGLVLLYLPAGSLKHSMYFYQHVEGDVFQLIENGKPSDQQIVFLRDEKGNVTKIKNEGNFHYRVISSEKN